MSDNSSNEPEGGGTATTEASDAACDGVTLEATDTGITADTITIQVMADTGSPLAPGLFQGNVDALKGFEEFVNANGGIGCRQLKVEEWDSKLTPEEAKNGQINACASALAMVGGNSLFNPDVTELETCADAAGQPTGIPDIAALANDVNEQCAKHAFIIQGIAEICPADGSLPTGTRELTAFVGQVQYYQTVEPDLVGLYLVPGDLPTTVQSATYQIGRTGRGGRRLDRRGEGLGPRRAVGLHATGPGGPQRQRQLRLRRLERRGHDQHAPRGRGAGPRQRQGVGLLGGLLHRQVRGGGADVDGTYLCMQFLPFEEKGTDVELDTTWPTRPAGLLGCPGLDGRGAVPAGGRRRSSRPTGPTPSPGPAPRDVERDRVVRRQRLDGPESPKGGFSDCMVMIKIGGAGFERVFPTEPGTLSCDPDYLTDGHPRSASSRSPTSSSAVADRDRRRRRRRPFCARRHMAS